MRLKVILKEGEKPSFQAELTETDLLMLNTVFAETASLSKENQLRRYCESESETLSRAWEIAAKFKEKCRCSLQTR